MTCVVAQNSENHAQGAFCSVDRTGADNDVSALR
jgi:hypothetical protein